MMKVVFSQLTVGVTLGVVTFLIRVVTGFDPLGDFTSYVCGVIVGSVCMATATVLRSKNEHNDERKAS